MEARFEYPDGTSFVATGLLHQGIVDGGLGNARLVASWTVRYYDGGLEEHLTSIHRVPRPISSEPEVGGFALISDGFIALSVSGDTRGSKANWAVTTHDGGRYFNSWPEIYPHIIRLYTPSGDEVTGFEYYKSEGEGNEDK